MASNQDTNPIKQGKRDRWIKDKLGMLDPGSVPPVKVARARFDARLSEKEKNMWQKIFAPRYRAAWVALAAVAVVVGLLSFPQVRVIANNFLGLFRVERIEAVDVGISLKNLPAEMESQFRAVDHVIGDQLSVDKEVIPVEVGSIAEASQLAGFQARMPAMPQGERRIHFQEASTIRLVIDQPRWEALLESMGYDDFVIPQSADGAEIKFNIPAGVIVSIGDCEYNQHEEVKLAHPDTQNCTVFLQSKSPTIEAPPGVDVNRAGQILLQTLGMSEAEAAEFSKTVNWATTLVVPVPSDLDYRYVSVEGVDGIFLEDSYPGGKSAYTLLWLKDGMLHALIGDGNLSDALQSVRSLK